MVRKNIVTTRTFTTLLITIIVSVAAWFIIVQPALRHLQEKVKVRNDLRQELAEIAKKKTLLTDIQGNRDQIQDDLKRLDTAIPDDSQTGEYVAALENLANNSGVSITSLSSALKDKKASSPKKEGAQNLTLEDQLNQQFYSTSIDIKTVSSYENLYNFITHLLNLDRFTVLGSVSMSKANDSDQLSTTLVISIYHRSAAKATNTDPTNTNSNSNGS